MQYLSDQEACSAIIEVGRRLYQRGLVAANDGNISCRVSDDTLWITPTGVSKGFLDQSMLIKVDLAGNVLTGTHKPSSENAVHLVIYQQNAEAQAVVHAHPQGATAFACKEQKLTGLQVEEARISLGEVPLVAYAPAGSKQLAANVAEVCRGHRALLLARHGVVCWGEDIWQSLFKMETVEHFAKILLYSRLI